MENKSSDISRRGILKASGAAVAGTLFAGRSGLFAAGSDKVRVGLIGCGGRGTRAGIINCAQSSKGVELVAIGDAFADKLADAPERIKKNLERKKLDASEVYKVTPDKMFSGLDAYQKVIDSDIDMVILTTPPYFRPEHFRAAVAAGRHVFVEKPIGVDPVGVRSVMETSDEAKRKGLTVVAGTQMRRARHIMAFMDRLHGGDIGDIVAGQIIRSGPGMTTWREEHSQRDPKWSDVEWQLRRWLFMTWAGGDLVVEQHVHNLDVANWAMGGHPQECLAMGGRQVRIGAEFGNIYDHFSAELVYPNGGRLQYMGRQMDGCSSRNDFRFEGTEGKGLLSFGNSSIEGKRPFKYEGESVNPMVQEYADMIDSIRNGKAINEGRQVAESSMTAIMIRMSAYTGRALKWDWCMKSSKLSLGPEEIGFTDFDMEPVAIPGKTQLV